MAIDNEVQASGIPWFQRIMKVAKKTETIIFADATLLYPFPNRCAAEDSG